ncbi:hypothetical protein PF003_g3299 [Phytophthora fragariae]|nr:hypothetical protein PF003_g3299 [Phytophthora fragariae]
MSANIIYKWLKWIVMRDMPFTEVGNELTRELTGMQSADPVSSRSITTYIQTLLPLVDGLISDGLPQRFAIMSDGWKDGTTHFVAVIAVFMQGEEAKEILLGFSPPLDERTYTAVAHRDLLVSILNVYSRALHDVVVLIGDNCATNKATADLLDVSLLGCACHKLNLTIQKFVNTAWSNEGYRVGSVTRLKSDQLEGRSYTT